MTSFKSQFLRIQLVASLALLFLLGSVMPSSATVIYSYAGNNFNDIWEIGDPPDGAFDTSMSVSGWFALDSALPVTSNLSDIRGEITAYSYFDGRDTMTQVNSELRYFSVATTAGEISQWDIWIHINYKGEDGLWNEVGEGNHRIVSQNPGVPYVVADVGQIEECTVASACEAHEVTDSGMISNNPGSWTFIPEPGTAALMLMGLAILALREHRQRH